MKKNAHRNLFSGRVDQDEVLQTISGGCGGMTQIDPPSLELDAGPSDSEADSTVDDLPAAISDTSGRAR